MPQGKKIGLVWLRRDLRLEDHTALAHAKDECDALALVFVFDTSILKKLADKADRRLSFIHQSLRELDAELRERGSLLIVKHGDPTIEIPKLAAELKVHAVYTHRDYEPNAKLRDKKVETQLKKDSILFHSFKDQVIFEGLEVITGSGGAFKVFTPYKNAWLAKLKAENYEERRIGKLTLLPKTALKSDVWDLEKIGFQESALWLKAGSKAAQKRLTEFTRANLGEYKAQRDFPSLEATSGLSVHLRFGTISVRACVRAALAQKNIGAETWLSELIWRDFYHMILDQNPYVVGHAYKKEYESIRWPGKKEHFLAWCEGRTGFPIVDAAMRHFNATGWMHNRLRMVVASFLTKDLLIDWREGEAYFARYLLDFDLAANNGGWQWSASTGCDAQPYFRIFNPYSQSERFDAEGEFIRSQIPELAQVKGKMIHCPEIGGLFGAKYPAPIVAHDEQRKKALALFK
jgi:deoxyribodipyrimidine photo-lyase